jgi:hypothetical protein
VIFISVDRCGPFIQVSIEDEHGGYRIAGPKYDGTSIPMLRRELSARDAEEIGFLSEADTGG